METNGVTRHAFVRPAAAFEPPIDAARICGSRKPLCGMPSQDSSARSRQGSDRRRPFGRGISVHTGVVHATDTRPGAWGAPSAHARIGGDAGVPDDARRGAEQALRVLLEVLDRRRPADKMGKMFAPNVVESIKTVAKTHPPGRRLGPASLRRLHVTRTAPNAAEVFGTYSRGPRVFAVAGRIEYRSTARSTGWTVTSLRVC